jgi:uncharacterized protein (TIGR02246 family)
MSAPPHATAEEQARAVFARFLDAFTAADPASVAALFWPDALVWGTTMPELGTTPDATQAYFAPIGRRAPGARRATAVSLAAVLVADSAVLISGVWQVEGPEGGPTPLRVSLAVTRRDGAWRIAQFHNSPMPAP